MQSQEKPQDQDETPETETAEDDAARPAGDESAAEATGQDAPEQAAAEADPPAGGVEAELAETKDRLLRALAEAENVRRRASRDVENATKRAFAGFAREMVVVADNLERAMQAVDGKEAEASDAVKGLIEGVSMTARELQNVFERNGIKKIEPLGEKFDPQVHEAMFEYEDPSKPAGSVGQVMEAGYILHGQPLRPAKVGVTKGGPKEAPAGDPPTPSEQVMKDGESDKKPASGGNAYEDTGKPSGSTLDEEL